LLSHRRYLLIAAALDSGSVYKCKHTSSTELRTKKNRVALWVTKSCRRQTDWN